MDNKQEETRMGKDISVMKNDIDHIKQTLDRLERNMTAVVTQFRDDYVTRPEIEGWYKDCDKRLIDVENWQTWAIRIALGSIITAALALVYTTGGNV